MDDIAAFLGVKVASVRRYRARPRERGGLPPEDHMFGRTPVWKPPTIVHWHEHERRGQGWRASRTEQAGSR
jgi:transposase